MKLTLYGDPRTKKNSARILKSRSGGRLERWLPVVSTAHHAAQLAATLAKSTRQRRKTSRSTKRSCMS